jgi:hypothetical protein
LRFDGGERSGHRHGQPVRAGRAAAPGVGLSVAQCL